MTTAHNDTRAVTAPDRETMARAVAEAPAEPAPIAGVAIWAKLPGQLADWYTAVFGIGFDERRHDDGRWHFVATGPGAHFEIKGESTPDGYPSPDLPRKSARCGISVTETSFEVPDATAAWERALALGAEELLPLETLSWGRFGSVLDPERNRVGIYERTS